MKIGAGAATGLAGRAFVEVAARAEDFPAAGALARAAGCFFFTAADFVFATAPLFFAGLAGRLPVDFFGGFRFIGCRRRE